MMKKLLKIADIFFGLVISSIFAYTVGQIMAIYLGNGGLIDKLSWLNTLLPWVIFVSLCFVWVKAKKLIFKIGIILALILVYLLGRAYASNTYQSAHDALTLYKEAYFSSGMAQMKDNDSRFLDAERKYVELLKEASEKPKRSLVGVRMLYTDIYHIAQEFLDYDEKLASGQIVASADEINKKADELIKKRDSRFEAGWGDPGWVSFFMVQ